MTDVLVHTHEHVMDYNVSMIQNKTMVIEHNYGFYSNCSVRLKFIFKYFNIKRELPEYIDTTPSFSWYKEKGKDDNDVFYDLFMKPCEAGETGLNIPYTHHINYYDFQFDNFKEFAIIDEIIPFIKRFYMPRYEIIQILSAMLQKYNIDYDNTCAIFYRGNDKAGEMILGDYDDFIAKAQKVQEDNPGMRFLIQSDETEFIYKCKQNLQNCVVFEDEIRHISRSQNGHVDRIDLDNYTYAKYFLAIIIIIAKCKHLIMNSGNISMWIYFYRHMYNSKNAHNFHQSLKNAWV